MQMCLGKGGASRATLTETAAALKPRGDALLRLQWGACVSTCVADGAGGRTLCVCFGKRSAGGLRVLTAKPPSMHWRPRESCGPCSDEG